MKQVSSLLSTYPEYERISLDGYDPGSIYVLHRENSPVYKLYVDGWNIAFYHNKFAFAVFPAYKSCHKRVLEAFMAKYIPDSPLKVSDFYPGCSKAYTHLFTKPEAIK